MHYERKGNWFYFDEELLPHFIDQIPFGVIKKFGTFMVLEPIPHVLQKEEYDILIMDHKMVTWSEMGVYTKDRLKVITGELCTPEEIQIVGFYEKKYDEDVIENYLERLEGAQKVPFFQSDQYWFGFDLNYIV